MAICPGRILAIDEPITLEWGRTVARAEQSDIARTGAAIVDPWRGV